MPKIAVVIPARYASKRFPGKPLARIHGKPMIQWVYERASLIRSVQALAVATDDERIADLIRGMGGRAILTSVSLQTGTDRIGAVAKELKADIYINLQGDEPLIDPLSVEKAIELVSSGRFAMSTLMTPFQDVSRVSNQSAVKVIVDQNNRAIYFSRFPIPYTHESIPMQCHELIPHLHIGVYVYTAEALKTLSSVPQSALEKAESLEQLRALELGIPIGVAEVDSASIGVDTPEDLEKVSQIMKSLIVKERIR